MKSGLRICFALLLAGCDLQDMYQQPKKEPLQPSAFFNDERSARPIEPGTVARGQLRTNKAFFAGQSGTNLVAEIPVPVPMQLLQRGRERFDIFCAPCHDLIGTGNGMIVQRGFRAPPSLHEERLRKAPAGHFYSVITGGFGKMPDYAAQVPPDDRWAIVAYIRALQLSQHAAIANLPAEDRQKINHE
jgi:mono/diheme cytochrome c family protein